MTQKELQMQQKKEVRRDAEPTKPQKQFIPAVDIFETDSGVTVRAEMPGADKNDLEIGLEDNVLTIKGIVNEAGNEKETILLKEFEAGQYLRRFTVAETIDQEKIEASMANGILTVHLPKIEPAKPRKIEIKTG